LLADGRNQDAQQQSELIRNFCQEEGVRRVEHMSGALIAEAERYLEQGRHTQAADALQLAASFDPGRPQVQLARASLSWAADRSPLAVARHLVAATRDALVAAYADLSLFNRLGLVFSIAVAVVVLLFSMLMFWRHNAAFRHEIEEWVVQGTGERWAPGLGWAAALMPLVSFVLAGWTPLYWLAITFRYMRRAERYAAVLLLTGAALALPVFRISVTFYGMTADPAVRSTLASAGGEYDPDRILKLQQLVQAYPDDEVYHFLLAGLYKNGSYFEDAYAEYKAVLELNPAMVEAYINIGNIFFTTGQYPEAVANYSKVTEFAPDSILAYFNMHLTQSESFRFKEAESSLKHAREIDSERLAELMAEAGRGESPSVIDATIDHSSVWSAALEGRDSDAALPGTDGTSLGGWLGEHLANPISIVAFSVLALFGLVAWRTNPDTTARRCIRCGSAFCEYCKSGREGREYCSQCLHLFVLGDGLAHETKSRKLYAVERYERWSRRFRGWISFVLPGAAQVMRGRACWGLSLVTVWIAAWILFRPELLSPLERLGGISLQFDRLGPGSVPAAYGFEPLVLVGLALLLSSWIAGNFWRFRGREV